MQQVDDGAKTGYRVNVDEREGFDIVGYTLIVPPGKKGEGVVPRFWDEVVADGRLARLKAACPERPWVLGLGSWDPECPKGGYRYTICVQQQSGMDRTILGNAPLFHMGIGASRWLRFELPQDTINGQFWKDNPYKMMATLGFEFHTGDYSVGLHFDAYPPGYDTETQPRIEFWITVV